MLNTKTTNPKLTLLFRECLHLFNLFFEYKQYILYPREENILNSYLK